ncbi:MAG: LysR family transcriptional regulator [Chlorobi bacterium]|nr:LysR family transcriptional regulator [Chlorobiota bacterium]
MISLIQMQYVVAVDTYRHFATAAEKCFVSQPTLSMQLKKMEEDLGLILFDRTRLPVVPTEAGAKVIEQCRIVLHEAERINRIAEESKDEISGEFRIGIIPTIAPYLLPLFAGEFKRKFPDIHLIVQEVVTEQIEELLQKDLLDAGILVTPLHNKNILEQPLYYEEMMIYVNSHHPLSSKQVIRVNDIATSDIWLLSDGHCFRHQVVNLCELENLESDLPFDFEGGSLDTIMKIIDREGGFTLIPELAGLEMKPGKEHSIRNFSNIVPLREVSLVYTRRFAKAKMIDMLADSINNSVPEHLTDKERGTIVEWR